MSEFIKPNPKNQNNKPIDLSKLGPGEFGDTASTIEAGINLAKFKDEQRTSTSTDKEKSENQSESRNYWFSE